MMQGIVIGGESSGMIITQIRVDATFIELSRPDYLRPLTSSDPNAQPDVAKVAEVYEVCTLWLLPKDKPDPIPFGLIIPEGKDTVWAFSELSKGFAENAIAKLKAENLIQ
jgi:hypothetical protein